MDVPKRLLAGIVLLAAGQTLIVGRWLPASYYYFPVIWYGFILTLDGGLEMAGRPTLWVCRRRVLVAMIPVSALFWWLFEGFDLAIRNWWYVGGGVFKGAAFFAFASLCFSTVIPAVWEAATLVEAVTDAAGGLRAGNAGDPARVVTSAGTAVLDFARLGDSGDWPHGSSPPPDWLLPCAFGAGIACTVIPILLPHYAFGLIWLAMLLILDPLNAWAGRPSLLLQALNRQFQTIVRFASAALVCGFFWEFWNYWAPIKWVYTVPYVSQLHLFEMPLPGYLGYLPFGLEVFAATVFCLQTVPAAVARHLPIPARPATLKTAEVDAQ